jgi:GMP synthase (glutamine-hydrolysing)
MARTAAVFQHLSFEDLGSFETVLLDRGYHINTYQLGADDVKQVQVDEPDLLVVLGGPISVNDVALFPFLRDEHAVLRARLALDAPCVGICLGAQLMSVALGGSVAPMARKEIGWSALSFSAELALDHPLRQLARLPVLHWHGEQFTIPAGATALASTDACPHQAFTWRKNGLALQFHPEVTARGLERWYIGHVAELSAAGCDIRALREEGELRARALRARAEVFFESWLSSCGL